MSEPARNVATQIARMTEEIGRTREICARTLQLRREPFPNSFLGNKLDPLRANEE